MVSSCRMVSETQVTLEYIKKKEVQDLYMEYDEIRLMEANNVPK